MCVCMFKAWKNPQNKVVLNPCDVRVFAMLVVWYVASYGFQSLHDKNRERMLGKIKIKMLFGVHQARIYF